MKAVRLQSHRGCRQAGGVLRCALGLKRGKPTRRPLRLPCLQANQFSSATTQSAIPEA